MLHAALPPTARFVVKDDKEKNKRKTTKISITDSRNSFLLHIKTINDFKPQIDSLKQKQLQLGATIQPLIVVIGSDLFHLDEYYLFFDDNRYKFNDFLTCLDTCFKLFCVFNLSFPKSSELVWTFIQKYFYCISTIHDLKSTVLTTFISDFNKIE